MKEEQLQGIRAWFAEYAGAFVARNPGSVVLNLKRDHSARVAAEARAIAAAAGWPDGDVRTAEALGWLHDAGRFSQMEEFGTIVDRRSVNHAERGQAVVGAARVLQPCSPRRRRQILDGIRHHNAMRIPDDVDADSLPYVRLIRDADKLDIFAIFIDNIRRNAFRDNPELTFGVDLDGPLTPEILAAVGSRQPASYTLVRSLRDWMLMQVAWVYDLQYPETFRRVRARRVLDALAGQLPDAPVVLEILAAAREEVERRAQE